MYRRIKVFILKFFQTESATGIVLLIATVLALIVANSPLSHIYHDFLDMHMQLGVGDIVIDEPIHHWINDGLMAIFFLLIGLEIKYELKHGELSTFQSALLPAVAAIGGATIPALIYWWFNAGTEALDGWAIPMATDIAFVIGIVALLGSKVPTWVKIFVTAIAVVDDLIAVAIIAFFFTDSINTVALGIAGGCLLLLILFNYRGVSRISAYIIVGFVMWWAVLESGIHATVAGVLLGMLVPAGDGFDIDRLKEYARRGFILSQKATDDKHDVSEKQALRTMEKGVAEAYSPLHRLENELQFSVYFIIMPIFAFANAGVELDPKILSQALQSTISWGVAIGLFLGKPIGILGFVWILTKLGFTSLEDNKETWKMIFGIAMLAGIGFTMSLFIGNLSFGGNAQLHEFAKIGILLGSLASGVIGYFLLKRNIPSEDET